MIKKMGSVVVLLLALNFIAMVGGTAWVWKSGHVDKDKIKAIKEVLYPPESQPTTATTEVVEATTRPGGRLDELLARASGRPASEQIEFIRETFAGENAELDHQRRELDDIRRQTELARQQLVTDRAALEQERIALAQQKDEQTRLASDDGFQQSLALYQNMPAKQAKTLFMGLSEATMTAYIQAMPTSKATKIMKEFKTAEELERLQKVMERLRVPPATQPAPVTAGAPTGPAT